MAPARVVSVDGPLCEVKLGSRVDEASMMLEPDLRVGDWVLVNSGTVVRKLEPDQADEMSRAFGIVFGLSDDPGEPALAQQPNAGAQQPGSSARQPG